MTDLIARIESADGPDWILDGAIWYSLSDRPALDPNIEPGGWPRYTASIDAALTLVPEGWFTFLATEDRHSRRWTWKLRGGFGVTKTGLAATPALALAAAALKARGV